MKRIVFLSFSVLMLYIGGMYRYPLLTVLAVGQLILLLFLTVQTHMCGRELQARFLRNGVSVVKGGTARCEIITDHKGKLSAGRTGFIVEAEYGCRGRKSVKRLYGDGGSGKTAFDIHPAYCGVLTIRLKEVRVYDSLLSGFVKKKLSEEMKIMVFPADRMMQIHTGDGRREDGREGYDEAAYVRAAGGDIHRIREYREGDSLRQLHWRLSARTDRLLIREYEREEEKYAELYIDLRNFDKKSPQEQSDFHELLSALILGLLRERGRVRVHYPEDEGKERAEEIAEPSHCRQLLAGLYGAEIRRQESDSDHVEGEMAGSGWGGKKATEGLTLNTELCLYLGKTLAHRFSGEHLEEEIRNEKIFLR